MQGRWVLPGGESYMARFLEDAGADYVYAENEKSAALIMDTEAVYAEVVDAEYWLHQYGWDSLSDVVAHDPRLGRLEAFNEGHVLNNDARVNEGGGNDFYESGPYRPDLVLEDLVRIFHPEQLPDHRLYYYRYLK
jgi:iron complex transport system substrate-binding protein